MNPRAPHRFYYSGHVALEHGGELELSAEESHHLLRVLRLRPGAQVDVFDASGALFSAELLEESNGIARVRVLGQIESELPGIVPAVHLAVAVIKRRAMELLIEKLSELGVETFQPLLTTRTVVRGESIQAHVDPPGRWERLAVAAAKQCGRNRPLLILPPAPVQQWLERPRPPGYAVYTHPLPTAERLGRWLTQRASVELPLWVAVGPEGGWSTSECEAFERHEFVPVQLGELTLRAETAAIAAAAACRVY